MDLDDEGERIRLTLAQDNNDTREQARHSQGMWDSLVKDVKAIAEGD